MGKKWKQCQTLFLWAPKSLQMVIVAMKLHKVKVNGGEITESCLADDHAWLSTDWGDHLELSVIEC